MHTTSRAALISVSDKTGIVTFASDLVEQHDYTVYATEGTAQLLRSKQVPFKKIETHTAFQQMMERYDTAPFNLVVVNMQPFQKIVGTPHISYAEVREQIDIGGPAILRAGAKNHESVGAICNPNDYGMILGELMRNRSNLSTNTRRILAGKVFVHTAAYDAAITEFLCL